MLSISNPIRGTGAMSYYLGLPAEDYYLDSGEPPGFWHGNGARELGLSGAVNKEKLRNLFGGFSPDGKTALVQNAGKQDRVSGWDLTFSAPKSVSVAWSLAAPDVRERIEAAHRQVVEKVLSYLEDESGLTRRGKGGKHFQNIGLLAAAFQHGTSRALDPQLHTHALVMNVCVRSDGTTGTIWSKKLFEHKMAAGALYRAELAAVLQNELGLSTRRTAHGFELEGVSTALMAEFSKRRHEIQSRLGGLGLSGAVASKVATLDTRNTKVPTSHEHLFVEWQRVGEEFGFGRKELQKLLGALKPAHNTAPDLIASEAAHKLIATSGFFTERELVRTTAEAALGVGLGSDEVLEGVRGELRRKDIVPCPGVDSDRMFTSRSLREEWRQMKDALRDAGKKNSHPVDSSPLKRTPLGELTETARHWLRDILSHDSYLPSRVRESEKSAILRAASFAWRLAGYSVLALSPTKKAAETLSSKLGVPGLPASEVLYDLGLVKVEKTFRSLLPRRTTLPHLELKIPSLRLRVKNPILIVDAAEKVKWPVLRNIVICRLLGAKLVLVLNSNPRPGTPIEWLIGALAQSRKHQLRAFQYEVLDFPHQPTPLTPLLPEKRHGIRP